MAVVLAWLVILVAVPLNWIVTLRLWRLYRPGEDIGLLKERTLLALVLAIVVTIFAAVFLNNGMEDPILDLAATQLLTRSAILGLSIPAIYWLFLFRNGNGK